MYNQSLSALVNDLVGDFNFDPDATVKEVQHIKRELNHVVDMMITANRWNLDIRSR